MKREVSPAVAIVIIVVVLLAGGVWMWHRTSTNGMNMQKFQDWKRKMQAATPPPGVHSNTNRFGAQGSPPAPAATQ